MGRGNCSPKNLIDFCGKHNGNLRNLKSPLIFSLKVTWKHHGSIKEQWETCQKPDVIKCFSTGFLHCETTFSQYEMFFIAKKECQYNNSHDVINELMDGMHQRLIEKVSNSNREIIHSRKNTFFSF